METQKQRRMEEGEFVKIQKAYGEFEKVLRNRRDEMMGRVVQERAQLDDQVMTAPGDEADISVVDTSADYFLKLANAHQRELFEIQEAVFRIEHGVFGICQSCGNAITLERLKKLPYARMCIECQSALEAGSRKRYA